MSARLLLVRHGQIKANRVGRWHGSTDSALTWVGRRQAKRTGKHIQRTYDIDAVYSSPLSRCQDTARYATRHLQLEAALVDGLAEMSIGEWENKTFKELAELGLFPAITDDPHYTAPGGESIAGVGERVHEAILDIDSQHEDGETVLVVTHGIALAVLLAILVDDDVRRWREYSFHNCSITELEVTPKPVVFSMNQYLHL